MDTIVALLAVAAWLLLMGPAALIVFVGADADGEGRPASPDLAVVPGPPAAAPEPRAA